MKFAATYSDCRFFQDDPPSARLTVLNFSAGSQSSALLWMVLRGDIPRPEEFLVLRADPGMENSLTYEYAAMMEDRCREAGIEFRVAPGPNLYRDLVELRTKDTDRIDNPPYWVKRETGKRGQLPQKCTREYKIRPMDREIRRVLHERFGLHPKNPHLGQGIVEKWIGFARDEIHRVKAPAQKYQRFAFPLIDLRLNREAIERYYDEHNLPKPPRSVCNACFANGLRTLREMHRDRPEDWAQAVRVDRAVRDLSQAKVKHPVFVSDTLLPLEDLAAQDFDLGSEKDNDAHSCDSGYCFT